MEASIERLTRLSGVIESKLTKHKIERSENSGVRRRNCLRRVNYLFEWLLAVLYEFFIPSCEQAFERLSVLLRLNV